MATLLEDRFYDCQSDSEIDDVDDNKGDHALRTVGGYTPNCHPNCQLMPYYDDPIEIRRTLERVAKTSRLLLRSVGGKCECLDSLEHNAARSIFYPASLEICARLVTDKSCPIPPNAQCRLRGDPITLKLPMELNPYSGQVNVNIFQPSPKPLTCQATGDGDRCFRAPTKNNTETGQGQGQGQGHGVATHAAMFQGPNVARRHTQRHDCVPKSGRKVRWPDVL